MDKFVSKLSLYDILSMVIPGGTIFLFFSMTLKYELYFCEYHIDSALGWIIALVASYLLGLINHICTAIIWKKFRKNHMLWREKECLIKKIALIALAIMIIALIIKCICCFFVVKLQIRNISAVIGKMNPLFYSMIVFVSYFD